MRSPARRKRARSIPARSQSPTTHPEASSAAAARAVAAAISGATSSPVTTPTRARTRARVRVPTVPDPASRIASNTAAQSPTERASTPISSSETDSGISPAVGMLPRVGLKPAQPQYEAGMRIDPSVSLPSAAAASPAATAAADPPLDPPGVNSRRCGLRHRSSQYADAYARRETDDVEIVLHRKRNAGERSERRALAPATVQRRGGIARRRIGYRKESVQFGTVARDALEVAVDGVARAHASRAHRRGQSWNPGLDDGVGLCARAT